MTGSPVSIWGFSTPAMDELFAADGVVSAVLRFEAALALSLSDVGMAPESETQAVAAACEVQVGDAEGLLATTWESGTPLLAIVELIEARLSTDDERRWVHHGSTTQDAIDTAYVLLTRDALGDLEAAVSRLASAMRALVIEHRDQAHMGRTFLQNALPTTFGLRVAGWLDPMLTHLENLRETRDGLAVQLGGPVGDLGAFGENGGAVVAALAKRLGLEAPVLAWHSDRSRVRAVVNTVDDAVASIAKVATDVALLAQSAVGEVTTRAGGSSSMPHKKNPVDAIRALAAADVCHGAAAMVRGGRPHELDRSLGSWQAEWAAMPLLFSAASAVIDAGTTLLESLEVNASAMESRVGEAPGPDTSVIDSVLDRYERLLGET
ncbi:MAG TPA: lyase family protein [Acidimicrobiia bacterium]